MDKLQIAEQFRRALQMFTANLDEEKALEVATVFPAYVVGKAYIVGEYFTYGVNSVGDPQLYKVVQPHTSQADWKPDIATSLYKAVGVTKDGYDEWSRPAGAHDAYNKGQIVDYKGTLYISLVDGNAYSPDEYPAYWEVYIG